MAPLKRYIIIPSWQLEVYVAVEKEFCSSAISEKDQICIQEIVEEGLLLGEHRCVRVPENHVGIYMTTPVFGDHYNLFERRVQELIAEMSSLHS